MNREREREKEREREREREVDGDVVECEGMRGYGEASIRCEGESEILDRWKDLLNWQTVLPCQSRP